MVKFLESRNFTGFALFVGFVLFTLTGFFNLGIIAIDDYAFVISQTIPAQSNSSAAILKNTGIWHPLLPYLLHQISSSAYHLGFEDPYRQLQFVLVLLAVFSFALQAALLPRFFETRFEKNIVLGFLTFYFISPLIFTRPMIESVAAPLLLLSLYLAHQYSQKGKAAFLWSAILVLSIASLIRYQIGVCALALPLLVGARRTFRDLIHLILACTAGFSLSGALDYQLTGEFHGSLRGYLTYNLYHSTANHGQQPFYTFLLLFIALSFPPLLVSSYKAFEWKKTYSKLLAPVLYFGLFLISHTLTPHKEERFMIPILPVFFILLTPLVFYLLKNGLSLWRWRVFLPLNLILLFLTSFSIPQSNIVGLVRYLDHSHQFTRIYSWMDTLVLFPTAFSLRTVDHKEVKDSSGKEFENLSCSDVIAFREAYKEEIPVSLSQLSHLASFAPGPLEALLVRLNPVRNARRGTIELYGKKGCPHVP